MSRTIRRKNLEKILQPCGSKINGFYTTYDKYVEYPSSNGHEGCPAYRAMTKQETAERYWFIHGESKHNRAWGPNRKDRKVENQTLDTYNKRELNKWVRSGDQYEPMMIANFKNTAILTWLWR